VRIGISIPLPVTTDYTCNFNLSRFNVLDHFLLTSFIFHNSVSGTFAIHDVDNIPDHDPVALQLALDMKCIGLHNKTHTPHILWIKVNESDFFNNRCMLSDRMCRTKLPTDALLLCNTLQCSDPAHFNAVNLYAKVTTDACNDAATASIINSAYRPRLLVTDRRIAACPAGRNL